MEAKRDLTPAERITAAYLIVVRGVQVQDVAVAFNVNLGRVSEAMRAIGLAANDPRGVAAALAPAPAPAPEPLPEAGK